MSRPPGEPRVSRALETCLYTAVLEETAAFYEGVLGLEPCARVEGRHVFFRLDGAMFLLFDPAQSARPGGDVPPHGATGPGHVAFAIPAAELDLWRDRLGALAVAVEREVEWPGGGRSLYLRDPAGNSVELATPSIWSIPEDELFGRAAHGP